jgi:hypothetical protein
VGMRFGTWVMRSHYRDGLLKAVEKNYPKIKNGIRRLLVTANVFLSSPILVNLIMEALSFCETSVLTRATRHNIQKTAFCIVTAEKTSYLTYPKIVTLRVQEVGWGGVR